MRFDVSLRLWLVALPVLVGIVATWQANEGAADLDRFVRIRSVTVRTQFDSHTPPAPDYLFNVSSNQRRH